MFIRILVFLFLFTLCSCSNNFNPEEFSGRNTIYLPLIGKDIALNPLDENRSARVVDFLFQPLLRVNENNEITPVLIEKWSSSGLEFTFILKKDIFWSDGHSLTSDNVVFSLNYLRDPSKCPVFSYRFDMIKRVEKVDDYSFKITLKKESALFPAMLKDFYPVADSGKIPENFSGSYKVMYIDKEKIYLSRNSKFENKDKPLIENIIFKIYPDDKSALKGLINNEIDLLERIPVEDYMELRKNSFCDFYILPSPDYTSMGFNFKNHIFSDIRVRKAIDCSIDRSVMVKYLLRNMGENVSGPFFPFMSEWYEKDIKPSPGNPDLACSLMKDAGWGKGKNGFWEKDGKTFYFTMGTCKNSPLKSMALSLITLNLKESGFVADPLFLEWDEFIDAINTGQVDAWLLEFRHSDFDPHNMTYFNFLSGMTPDKGGLNYGYYSNKDVDRLLLLGEKELNRKERVKLYKKFQKIIKEDLPVLYLYNSYNITAVNKRINVSINKKNINLFSEYWKWKVNSER